jgi:hypothetical protein
MENFLATHRLHKQNNTKILHEIAMPIPKDLVAMQCQLNSNSYSNGFLSFVSPEKFQHYFSMWNLNPVECFPFIKFAFGHLVFFHQSQYKVLNPVYNCIDILGEKDELDFVMDIMLCDRTGLENSFFIDIYEQLWDKLGTLHIQEIYAFVPAINLGGSRDVLNVRRVSMYKEMMMLSQI